MAWLVDRDPESYLYEHSYLLEKRLKVKHADRLSKLVIPFTWVQSGNAVFPTFNLQFRIEYEATVGIIQRFGQQWLARDYLETLQKPRDSARDSASWGRSEYHFTCFIMLTKSNLDFIAHLINQSLNLGCQGSRVDLARAKFRSDIARESSELGETINRQGSWIVEVSKFRREIEHRKTVPLTTVNPDELAAVNRGKNFLLTQEPVLRFPTVPLSFTDSITLTIKNTQKTRPSYRTRPVLPYCDLSLKKTREIVETTFKVAADRLEARKR